ncbi:MAG: hypothetical protein ACPGNV_07360 [Mangrovicoccus sp.]
MYSPIATTVVPFRTPTAIALGKIARQSLDNFRAGQGELNLSMSPAQQTHLTQRISGLGPIQSFTKRYDSPPDASAVQIQAIKVYNAAKAMFH